MRAVKMAISWSEDISSGAPINGSNVAEIKNEIDNIASYLSVSLTWDHFDSDGTPADTVVKSVQAQELRSNTETIESNKHSAVYSGHNDGDNGSDYGTYESGVHTVDNGTHNGSVT